MRDALDFIANQASQYQREGKGDQATNLAWADFCQVLFGLNEFTYIP